MTIKNLNNEKNEINQKKDQISITELTFKIKEFIMHNYYLSLVDKVDNSDVNINHLENIFTNETYYLAMKVVPLIERKILFLAYIENCKLNDICRKLKLSKTEVIRLKYNAIKHFKANLATLYKADNIKRGGKN